MSKSRSTTVVMVWLIWTDTLIHFVGSDPRLTARNTSSETLKHYRKNLPADPCNLVFCLFCHRHREDLNEWIKAAKTQKAYFPNRDRFAKELTGRSYLSRNFILNLFSETNGDRQNPGKFRHPRLILTMIHVGQISFIDLQQLSIWASFGHLVNTSVFSYTFSYLSFSSSTLLLQPRFTKALDLTEM